jgi:ATP-binding cassette subfamily C (CFTR/MRP) protein 1
MLILDDSFSALDGETERHVVQNLLGPTGVLRRYGVTVFLITNNGEIFSPF